MGAAATPYQPEEAFSEGEDQDPEATEELREEEQPAAEEGSSTAELEGQPPGLAPGHSGGQKSAEVELHMNSAADGGKETSPQSNNGSDQQIQGKSDNLKTESSSSELISESGEKSEVSAENCQNSCGGMSAENLDDLTVVDNSSNKVFPEVESVKPEIKSPTDGSAHTGSGSESLRPVVADQRRDAAPPATSSEALGADEGGQRREEPSAASDGGSGRESAPDAVVSSSLGIGLVRELELQGELENSAGAVPATTAGQVSSPAAVALAVTAAPPAAAGVVTSVTTVQLNTSVEPMVTDGVAQHVAVIPPATVKDPVTQEERPFCAGRSGCPFSQVVKEAGLGLENLTDAEVIQCRLSDPSDRFFIHEEVRQKGYGALDRAAHCCNVDQLCELLGSDSLDGHELLVEDVRRWMQLVRINEAKKQCAAVQAAQGDFEAAVERAAAARSTTYVVSHPDVSGGGAAIPADLGKPVDMCREWETRLGQDIPYRRLGELADQCSRGRFPDPELCGEVLQWMARHCGDHCYQSPILAARSSEGEQLLPRPNRRVTETWELRSGFPATAVKSVLEGPVKVDLIHLPPMICTAPDGNSLSWDVRGEFTLHLDTGAPQYWVAVAAAWNLEGSIRVQDGCIRQVSMQRELVSQVFDEQWAGRCPEAARNIKRLILDAYHRQGGEGTSFSCFPFHDRMRPTVREQDCQTDQVGLGRVSQCTQVGTVAMNRTPLYFSQMKMAPASTQVYDQWRSRQVELASSGNSAPVIFGADQLRSASNRPSLMGEAAESPEEVCRAQMWSSFEAAQCGSVHSSRPSTSIGVVQSPPSQESHLQSVFRPGCPVYLQLDPGVLQEVLKLHTVRFSDTSRRRGELLPAPQELQTNVQETGKSPVVTAAGSSGPQQDLQQDLQTGEEGDDSHMEAGSAFNVSLGGLDDDSGEVLEDNDVSEELEATGKQTRSSLRREAVQQGKRRLSGESRECLSDLCMFPHEAFISCAFYAFCCVEFPSPCPYGLMKLYPSLICL